MESNKLIGHFGNYSDCLKSILECGFVKSNMLSHELDENQTEFSRKNHFVNPISGKYLDIAIVQKYRDGSYSILFG